MRAPAPFRNFFADADFFSPHFDAAILKVSARVLICRGIPDPLEFVSSEWVKKHNFHAKAFPQVPHRLGEGHTLKACIPRLAAGFPPPFSLPVSS